jgi:glycerophosphoryl diester phosphodiesterase
MKARRPSEKVMTPAAGAGQSGRMTLVIAHRGASHAAPENTVEAFRLATAMGADGIELDVRRGPGGRLVVRHDPLPPGPEVPTGVPDLAEALAACGTPLVNIEIKNDPDQPDFDPTRALAPLVVAAAREAGDPARWLISSFDLEMIDAVRRHDSSLATAWLVEDVPADVIDVLLERGHRALHPSVTTLDRAMVDACHAAGLAVNTWTCDDPERIRELIGWGVDGICTNVPDVAIAVRAGA